MSSDQRLDKKINQQSILHELSQLSGSELNSFLLKLYQERAGATTPGDLARQYTNNRFVKEAGVDPLAFKRYELSSLELAAQAGFKPVILSPLAPLGTCSSIAEVNQNNVVSANRGTEVLSDITNVLALKIADSHKSTGKNAEVLRFAATHRLVRAQAFDNPALSPHFGLLGLVSGGFDQGSFGFEIDQIFEHIHFHHQLLQQAFGTQEIYSRIMLKEKAHPFNDFLRQRFEEEVFDYPTDIIQEEQPNNYYQLVQFKSFLKIPGQDLNLSDGGLVDWTQKLIPNKKHRLFISASGIELIHKFAGSQ